jgi:hypothetical protein
MIGVFVDPFNRDGELEYLEKGFVVCLKRLFWGSKPCGNRRPVLEEGIWSDFLLPSGGI